MAYWCDDEKLRRERERLDAEQRARDLQDRRDGAARVLWRLEEREKCNRTGALTTPKDAADER